MGIDYGGSRTGTETAFDSDYVKDGNPLPAEYCLVECAPGYAPCHEDDRGADGRQKCEGSPSPEFEESVGLSKRWGDTGILIRDEYTVVWPDRWGRTYVLCAPGDGDG